MRGYRLRSSGSSLPKGEKVDDIRGGMSLRAVIDSHIQQKMVLRVAVILAFRPHALTPKGSAPKGFVISLVTYGSGLKMIGTETIGRPQHKVLGVHQTQT